MVAVNFLGWTESRARERGEGERQARNSKRGDSEGGWLAAGDPATRSVWSCGLENVCVCTSVWWVCVCKTVNNWKNEFEHKALLIAIFYLIPLILCLSIMAQL